MNIKKSVIIIAAIVIAAAVPRFAAAHCDSLDGPVVLAARAALQLNDVTPLLKWVQPQDEAMIREAFNRTVAVRRLGPEAQQLADTWFFETLVRVHRAGEGAPYTGLKAAGEIAQPVQEADRALESGSVDKLAEAIGQHAAEGLRERFARAQAAKSRAAESVQAGRTYVEAYVDYVHYVEGLANVIHGGGHHEGPDKHP